MARERDCICGESLGGEVGEEVLGEDPGRVEVAVDEEQGRARHGGGGDPMFDTECNPNENEILRVYLFT